MREEEFHAAFREARASGTDMSACVRLQCGGAFLLLRRSADDSSAGIYELPGGAVEPGESLEDAAVRELLEEAGIMVTKEALRPLRVFQFRNVETGARKAKFAFAAVLPEQPAVTLSPDHVGYAFLSPGEIERLPREGRDAKYVLWANHYSILTS